MAIVTCFLLALLSVSAFAGNAVLLTSLELKPRQVRDLEKKFLQGLQGTNLSPVIHHQVDPHTLHSVLTSDETEVLIWVSHAAKEKEQMPGWSANAIIADVHGNDVKNFFTTVPKNMRFLGVVGCQAQNIFDAFRSRGNFELHPQLEIMSFNKKVSLGGGFKKTIKAMKVSLQRPRVETPSENVETIDITVSKINHESSPSLQSSWAEIGDQVLAFFPIDERSASTAQLPRSIWNKIENKNIKHFRTLHAEAKDESFGKLEITTSEADTWWTPFELRGRLLGGKNGHLYQFKK